MLAVGLNYEDRSLMCNLGSEGRPHQCGYGCEEPKKSGSSYYKSSVDEGDDIYLFCQGGCPVPFPGAYGEPA